jgi:hypothetical protein
MPAGLYRLSSILFGAVAVVALADREALADRMYSVTSLGPLDGAKLNNL